MLLSTVQLSKSIGATPFLRWAGSKRQMLSKLVKYYPAQRPRYFEPFMGSAALFFELNPDSAVLGDLNIELVDTFRCVRDQADRVYALLAKMRPSKEYYYKLRSLQPALMRPDERAARFIFLNRFCFNGLFRTNSMGQFNVPHGSGKTGQLPTYESLISASQTLKKALLVEGDFGITIEEVRCGDFVYLDPPYAVNNRRIFRQYGPATFGQSDLIRIAECLDIIEKRGATFVMTYADCREARSLFAKWSIRRTFVQRNISGFSKNRRRAAELIISNLRD